MILEALAAAATASAPPAEAPATPVSPLTVRPLPPPAVPPPNAPPAATVGVPTDDNGGGHFASVWPEGAYRASIVGRVVLSCEIDRFGLAEWCRVVAETPQKMGFGAAALELRPTLKLKPAVGPDGPVDKIMNIAIEFTPHNLQLGPGGDMATFAAPAMQRESVTMLDNPVWASTVSYADLIHAYPAKAGGVAGYAVAHCAVNPNGSLTACQVTKEDPEKHGFGKAAIGLAERFRVAPPWTKPPHRSFLWVDVPVRFPAPGADDDRAVSSPYWVAGFDPDRALKVFPKEAADKGLSSGLGVAKCTVAVDGSLSDCAPQPADPEGLGFSEAAVQLASTMRLNPWLADGEPVDGTSIEVRVRLNLKPQP
jgi:TonB family protein